MGGFDKQHGYRPRDKIPDRGETKKRKEESAEVYNATGKSCIVNTGAPRMYH